MRIWISTDMEGIGGVVHREHAARDGKEHERARRWMTAENNAAVAAAFDVGATAVVVSDGHGTCRNIIPEDLDRRAKLCAGQQNPLPPSALQGLDDSFDGIFLVGYHARAGHAPGVLDHTAWSQTVSDVNINGASVGEAEIVAAYAGRLGIACLLVTGDDVLASEIEQSMPGTVTAVVKRALGRFHAECLHPEESKALIYRKAREAMGKIREIKPLVFRSPITLTVTFLMAMYADMAALLPGSTRVDALRVSYTAADYKEIHNAFTLMCAASGIPYYTNR